MNQDDMTQPLEHANKAGRNLEVIELGDAAELTLGSGGSGSEDKRRQYN
ncbi:albusnodin family lasso peptide [Nocardioides sp. NPDC057577]